MSWYDLEMFYLSKVCDVVFAREAKWNRKVFALIFYLNAILLFSTALYVLVNIPEWYRYISFFGWSLLIMQNSFFMPFLVLLVVSWGIWTGALMLKHKHQSHGSSESQANIESHLVKDKYSFLRIFFISILRVLIALHILLLLLGLLDLLLLIASVFMDVLPSGCPWNYMLGNLSLIPHTLGLYTVVSWLLVDSIVYFYVLCVVVPLVLSTSFFAVTLKHGKIKSLLVLATATAILWTLLWLHNGAWLHFKLGELGCYDFGPPM